MLLIAYGLFGNATKDASSKMCMASLYAWEGDPDHPNKGTRQDQFEQRSLRKPCEQLKKWINVISGPRLMARCPTLRYFAGSL